MLDALVLEHAVVEVSKATLVVVNFFCAGMLETRLLVQLVNEGRLDHFGLLGSCRSTCRRVRCSILGLLILILLCLFLLLLARRSGLLAASVPSRAVAGPGLIRRRRLADVHGLGVRVARRRRRDRHDG